MGGFIQSVRSALLNHYFGKSTLTAPTIYVGLSSTTPTSTGTNVTEPSGGNYARIATAAGDWNTAVDGDPCIIDNATSFTFAQANADWLSGADLTHAVLFDAPTGGNVVGWGALTAAKPVLNGDTAQYAAGALDVTLNGA
jgi:hypothetical protein